MRALIVVLTLCACANSEARLEGGDYADAATTAAVIASPALVELNPLVQSSNPVVGAATLLGLRYAGKAALIQAGYDPDLVNSRFASAGWAVACWNAALLAGAPSGGLSLAAAGLCLAATYE